MKIKVKNWNNTKRKTQECEFESPIKATEFVTSILKLMDEGYVSKIEISKI